jgi:hypothetical protein
MPSGGARKNNGGGPQPNSGRAKKPLTKRSIATQQKVATDPRPMPLEIMCETMWEHWEKGEKKEACAIAEKAAMYLHPRLSSVEAKVENVTTYSDEQLAAELAREFGSDLAAIVLDAGGAETQH